MSASIEPEVDSVVPLLKKRTGATGAHAFSRFAFALLLPALLACENTDEATSTVPAAISLTSELGGSADGYERACAPRDFVFPDDHGAHPGYRNEWWYVTGNLNNEDGRKFGFHATFFRIANQPPAVDGVLVTTGNPQAPANAWLSSSEWAATQFYMGHFAISEEGTKKSLAHERFARAAAGLAGAAAKPVRVWLDDWQLLGPTLLDERYRHEDDRPHEVAQEGTQLREEHEPWQLTMSAGNEAVDLSLLAVKPPVLQGDEGLSYKSNGDCNASYYYSISRLIVGGEITRAGITHKVIGTAWIDREWSSSVLAADQVGWDWFALQLSDGRDLMIYQLRKKDGRADAHSYAVEIDAAGNKKIIPYEQIDIAINRWWKSPTGARYPVAGSINRTDTGETMNYRPLIDNQELPLTVRYWEGAILVTDEFDRSIGHGYLELTGY